MIHYSHNLGQVEEESEGHNLRMEKEQIRNTVKLHDSALLTWGDGKDGKLGHHTEESLHVPYVITALQQIPIMSAALGKRHSLFLTEEGMILACGNGQFGQLGLGAPEDVRLTPVLIQGLHSIKQIAAGEYHSMALNDQGVVYSWGSGSWGKLGLSYDGNVSNPRVISTLTSSSVKFVACGGHHSACISFSGHTHTTHTHTHIHTHTHTHTHSFRRKGVNFGFCVIWSSLARLRLHAPLDGARLGASRARLWSARLNKRRGPRG